MEDVIIQKVNQMVTSRYNIDELLEYSLDYFDVIEKPHILRERVCLIRDLIKDNNIKDTLTAVKERLNIDLFSTLRVELRCCCIYLRYIINNETNKVVDELKNDTGFLERLYIRILLLEEGWNEESIERFINKHYTMNYTIKCEYYKCRYMIIKRMLNIPCNKKFKGRPSLPVSVKNILLNYRRGKMREIMNEKYSISRDLNKLFTIEEIHGLKDLVNNSTINTKEKLIHKLETLLKYT
jgi:hypothetical protein